MLVVDDNPVSSDVVRQQIEGAGGSCATATDVASGLGMARAAVAFARPFHVALLDHQMPHEMVTIWRQGSTPTLH